MATKFTCCLLALALVSVSNSKISASGASAADADGDLQQRQEAMAEVVRVFSNPASAAAADSDTLRRAASFMKREMGPLAPIFRAISTMPKKTAADVRIKDKAFDAAQELMNRHFRQLLAPHGSTKSAKSADDDDGDLAQRLAAMAEVVGFGHHDSVAAADADTIHRVGSFLMREMGPLQDIFIAILNMPETGADAVRVRDEAFDAAMELLDRKFRLLLPHGRPNTDDDVGFAIGKMTDSTPAEIQAKAEARAAAKEMMSRHLGQLLPGGGSFNLNDDL